MQIINQQQQQCAEVQQQKLNSDYYILSEQIYFQEMSQNDVGSLLDDANSTDDLQPQQLSGDESAEKSLLASDISGTKANFLLTVTTIMKTVIGAGILSLPLTTSRLGYVFCLLMFVIIISIIQFSTVMLLKSKNLSKHSNFSSICYHIFRSKISQMFTSFAIFINNTGICIVQLTIIKGAIGKLFDDYIKDDSRDSFFLSSYFIVIVVALLQAPITFVNKIQKLKFLAFIGVFGITVFVVTLAITFFVEMSEPARDWACSADMVPFASDVFNMAIVIPNMMLALSFQMNFFPIFKGMKDSRDQKMSKASLTGVCACSIFYILVGNMGYCLYGNEVKANFLLSFKKQQTNEVLFLLMNIGFLISVFFSFPVMYFGARNNFIAITKNLVLIIRGNKGEYRMTNSDNIEQISSYIKSEDKAKRKKKAKLYFIIYTIVLFLFIIGIGVSVDDIEIVFNFVGATAANAISFIFPSMFYFMLVRKKNKPRKPYFYVAGFLFCFFIPFGIFSVVTKALHHQ